MESFQSQMFKQYYFKDKHVEIIFNLLNTSNKLKLPDIKRLKEVGKTNKPNYCVYN